MCLLGRVVHRRHPEPGGLGGLDGVEGVLKHHRVLLVGLKAAHSPLVDLGALLFAAPHLRHSDKSPEVVVDPCMAEGCFRQRAVRGSGHIHPHALHLQKGQKLVHAGLCLDLMLIEIRDPVHYPADQLLLRLGEVVVLLAVGDPVPEGEGLQHLAGLRLGLDAKAPQDAGAQVPPDRHGVQQGAVHIKNRALQSHGNSFRLLPMVPIVPPEQAKAQ